jgi:hypothetical protein
MSGPVVLGPRRVVPPGLTVQGREDDGLCGKGHKMERGGYCDEVDSKYDVQKGIQQPGKTDIKKQQPVKPVAPRQPKSSRVAPAPLLGSRSPQKSEPSQEVLEAKARLANYRQKACSLIKARQEEKECIPKLVALVEEGLAYMAQLAARKAQQELQWVSDQIGGIIKKVFIKLRSFLPSRYAKKKQEEDTASQTSQSKTMNYKAEGEKQKVSGDDKKDKIDCGPSNSSWRGPRLAPSEAPQARKAPPGGKGRKEKASKVADLMGGASGQEEVSLMLIETCLRTKLTLSFAGGLHGRPYHGGGREGRAAPAAGRPDAGRRQLLRARRGAAAPAGGGGQGARSGRAASDPGPPGAAGPGDPLHDRARHAGGGVQVEGELREDPPSTVGRLLDGDAAGQGVG